MILDYSIFIFMATFFLGFFSRPYSFSTFEAPSPFFLGSDYRTCLVIAGALSAAIVLNGCVGKYGWNIVNHLPCVKEPMLLTGDDGKHLKLSPVTIL